MYAPNGLPLNTSSQSKIITEKGSYSYSDLERLSLYYCSFLKSRTLAVFFGSNTFESLAFYIAAINSETPIIVLPSNSDTSQSKRIISLYRPSLIFSQLSLELQGFKQVSSDLYIADNFTVLDESDAPLPLLLLPTSGSTGSPKLVKVSSNNLFSNTISISKYLDIRSNSRHITTLPLSYTTVFLVSIHTSPLLLHLFLLIFHL